MSDTLTVEKMMTMMKALKRSPPGTDAVAARARRFHDACAQGFRGAPIPDLPPSVAADP